MLLGYLFIIIACAGGAIKGHCSKRISGIYNSTSNISLVNAIRMILCAIIGFFIVLIASKGFDGFKLDKLSTLVCLLSGFSTAFFVITWTLSVKKSAYSLLNVFLVMSSIIPIAASHFIFNEEVKLIKLIGFAVLLGSVIFMWAYSNKIKGKFRVKDVILLLICGIFNGLSLFAQKWRTFECKETLSAFSFNFYSFVFAFVILVLFYLLTRKTMPSDEKFEFKKVYLYIIILSIALFVNTLFTTLAAERLPSTVLYPLSNGLGLITATTIAHVLYGEKINRYSIIGISLALASFVLMVL